VAGSTGNVFPTAGASVDRAGSTAWTNPGNVVSDNASGATTTVPTDYLVTSAYGFAIPATCRILGVTVRVEVTEAGSGSSSFVPQLHSATTPTLIGAAKSAVTVTTGPTVYTSGGVADLWSATLTPAIVNNAGFGVSIWSTDTINTLDVDYITIAIEYGEEAPWLTGQETFRKRRNTTNRRWLAADGPLSVDTPAETSDDRALEAPFRTVVLRSRRALSIGWMDALTAQIQAPAVPPVSAWLAPVVIKRRETKRRLIVLDQAVIERYTPPSIAWSDPPNVIRVEFKRKLQELAAQVELPPPVAPPTAQGFPAWTTVPLPATSQDRRLQSALESPVYPQTPQPEPNFCARIPTGFHKRRETERRLLTVELDEFTATPAGEVSDDRALAAPFVTRKTRSRRHLRAPELLAVAAAEPPGPSEADVPAFTLTKAKRRKSRQGLFLSSGDTVEARVQAQYPSWPAPLAIKRRETARTLRVAAHNALYPATPVPEQPPTAYKLAEAINRRETERTLRIAEHEPSYSVTPVYAANQLVRAIRRRETKRRLLVLELNEYPASPPSFSGTIPNLRERQNTGSYQLAAGSYFSGADSYSIAPAVEAGWSFDTNTGMLTFDTDAVGTFGTYVVTATNAQGTADSNAFSVEVYAVVTEGGRARKPRRHQHLVEIDGQFFEVSGPEEAERLLRQAAELAPEVVEKAVQRNVKRAKRGKQAVEIAPPVIKTEDPELVSLVDRYRDDIEAIYRRIAVDAEIRELMRVKLLEQDEDEAIFVLLH
jgi:hypothetical protein